jgi:hypothetical protein
MSYVCQKNAYQLNATFERNVRDQRQAKMRTDFAIWGTPALGYLESFLASRQMTPNHQAIISYCGVLLRAGPNQIFVPHFNTDNITYFSG